MGPRAGMDRCGKSLPHRDSIPDRPARSSVAIPTKLPGPYYVYTEWPKKMYTILLINIFGINLNEISISG